MLKVAGSSSRVVHRKALDVFEPAIISTIANQRTVGTNCRLV